MACFRLDNYEHSRVLSTEVVDAFDNDDIAVRFLLDQRSTRECKLYCDETLIGEMSNGVWINLAARPGDPIFFRGQERSPVSPGGDPSPSGRGKADPDVLPGAGNRDLAIASIQSQIAALRAARGAPLGGRCGQAY